MILKYIGSDNWERPVYQDEQDTLWKDVDPRKNRRPDLCTCVGNEFYGEPLTNMSYMEKYNDVELKFVPERVVW